MAIEIDAKVMIEEVCLTLLLPACVGMFLRRFSAVDAFYNGYKQLLGMSSAVALSSIPFLKIGSSHDQIMQLENASILGVVLITIVLHTILLCGVFAVTQPFMFPTPVRKAVVILGGQKSAVVAFAVVAFLPAELGDAGIIVIPSIIGQVAQILIDSVVASRWARQSELSTPLTGVELPARRS
jgi:sodium/bile acid cotransporter 7